MSKRPEWCIKASDVCGCYPGSGRCQLDQELIRTYPNLKDRKEARKRLAELAKEDPEAVARQCLRTIGL